MIGRKATAALALAAGASIWAAPAWAQATRTWVSGVGDDANPCSRTAPCKTFAGAISKTAAGGEINCLDSGGFGSVTITKSIAIICDSSIGGVLASGGANGITVNAGANDMIFLSGLDIQGAGSGSIGIRFMAGGVLHVRNSVVRGFNAGAATGISFTPAGASQLTVTEVTIGDNGAAGTGGGIVVRPSGTGAARLLLRDSLVRHNVNAALTADTTGTTASVVMIVEESQFIASGNGLVLTAPSGSGAVQGTIADSLVALNSGVGLNGTGGGVRLRVANTTITANATGVAAASGANVQSYGTNRLDGNGSPGAFTGTILPQQ